MTIEIGYKIPKETLRTTTKNGIEEVATPEIFGAKLVYYLPRLALSYPPTQRNSCLVI
jgi:hypothetical protein